MDTTTLCSQPSYFVDQKPTSILSQKTLLHLLNTKCTTSLQSLKQVHSLILKTGHFQDHFVSGTLLKCYAIPHFNNLDFALQLFDHIPKPNVFVYNLLVKSCLDYNEPRKAIDCYYRMVVENYRPNKFTFPTLLKACSVGEARKEGLQVHSHLVKYGFSDDGHVICAGIQMYANFGLIEDARRLLDKGGDFDVISCNAMIAGYFRCSKVGEARELFENMEVRNVGSWNAMISGLCRCELVSEARDLFDQMKDRDDISWSSMIDGYVKSGCYKEALEVFNLMEIENVRPNKFVLSSLLSRCAEVGALDQGRWVHSYIKKSNVFLDAVLGTALVDMYAKCGRLDMAWDVFENMKEKEVFTWNAMICGLVMHGRAEDAIELFFKMQREKFRPNGVTFVGVLNACAHGGMVEEGLKILNSMNNVYNVEPEVEHYGCVVDLLGRAGRLEEAEELIFSMPMEPSASVWGALLGACRRHGNVELGERVGKILLRLEPHNSGRYALLSNMYAKAGRWDDVAEVRKLMKERGVKTTSGVSLTEFDGTLHEFKMGDRSYPQSKDVQLMLKNVIERLKTEGYVPNTSEVLFYMDEEEKETVLQYHSEKLAIAFGLINTQPGATIRIVKNLRVCEDCHSAIKLISQVYDREIILRDRVRYHHFKNGTCSCKDFW